MLELILCFKLASVAIYEFFGDDYDIEIFEAHHRGKRCAFRNCIKVCNLIADALGQDTLENAVYERKRSRYHEKGKYNWFSVDRVGYSWRPYHNVCR